MIRHVLAATLLATPALSTQFTAPMALPGDLDPVPAAGAEFETDQAAGDDHHLVVWVDRRSDLPGIAGTGGHALGKQDVYARRLDAAGEPVDAAFLLARLPFEARRPAVAWNGQGQWLVVWEARAATQTTTYVGIRGVRVDADGTILDEEPLLIDDTHGVDERFADVAGGDGRWMVVWQDYDLVTSRQNVSGAIVEGDGTLAHKAILASETPTVNAPRYAAVAQASGRFLVVWDHTGAVAGGLDILGQFFDAALVPLGAEFGIGDGSPSSHALIASNGIDFCVTWDASKVALVSSSGVVSPPGGRTLNLASAAYSVYAPPAWLGDRWVVASTNLNGHVLVDEIDLQANTIASGVLVDRPDRVHDLAIDTIGDRAVVTWSEDVLEHSDTVSTTLESGLLAGPLRAVGAGRPQQIGVDIDGDPSRGYVVAWVDANSGTKRIMLQRLDGAGHPIDLEPHLIHEVDSLGLRQARVAMGNGGSLVVWDGRDALGFPVVHAKRVTPDGDPIEVDPIEVLPGSMSDVDFESDVYLAVSTHEPTNHYRFAIGARVAMDGTLLDAQPLSIGPNYSRFPRVGSSGGRFLVAWSRFPSHDNPYSSTQARFVDPNGSTGSRFSVESAPNSTRGPIVSGGDGEFLVTYNHDSDVLARIVKIDGTLLGSPSGFHFSFADRTQSGASAAPIESGWVAAWTDDRRQGPLEPGIGDIYGARVDSQGTLLDIEGLPIATDPWIEGKPVLAGNEDGVALACVAWSEVHNAFRVHVARYAAEQIGTRVCSPAVPNSSGTFASLYATGSASAFANDVTLHLEGAPAQQFALFLTSETEDFVVAPGGSRGNLCLGGTIGRFSGNVVLTDANGRATLVPDLTRVPVGPGIPVFPGETWYFQAWMRDVDPVPTSNFSDAIAIDFE